MATIRAAANSIAKAIPSRAPTDLRHRRDVGLAVQHERGVHRPGAFHEQLHRRRVGTIGDIERRDRPQLLCLDAQPLPAGGEHPHRRAASKDRLHHIGCRVQTCSQLSNTTNTRRPDRACATLAVTDIPA